MGGTCFKTLNLFHFRLWMRVTGHTPIKSHQALFRFYREGTTDSSVLRAFKKNDSLFLFKVQTFQTSFISLKTSKKSHSFGSIHGVVEQLELASPLSSSLLHAAVLSYRIHTRSTIVTHHSHAAP
jgi:hypothetical protein